MAHDEALARRLRDLLRAEADVTERHMFGGLAFLLGGHLCVAASGQGGLLARVDPEQTDACLAADHATAMEMRGRPMEGWIRVAPDGVRTGRQLAAWVRRSVGYVRTLPPK